MHYPFCDFDWLLGDARCERSYSLLDRLLATVIHLIDWFLDALESEGTVESLDGQQLNGRHWSKACPDWNKTSPQTQWTFLTDRLH